MKRLNVHCHKPRGIVMLCDKYRATMPNGDEIEFFAYNHVYIDKPICEYNGRMVYPLELAKLEVWDRDRDRWLEVNVEMLP